MANGAVPIGYASGSIPEVIGAEGLVTPEGDGAALAAAVLDLLADPPCWAALRSTGLKRAAEIDWTAVTAGMVEMYEQALHAGAPGTARPDRASAVREFGPPARTSVSARPFALPVLRESALAHRILEPAVDLVARRHP